MTETRELAPPVRHGEVLCVPELRGWMELAEQTAGRLEGASVRGEPLGRLRGQARAELVQRASELLGRWDLPVPEASPSGPWVVTGHQPTLFHPGIWIKTWGVNACCARGAVGLNVVVDSDACEAWKARVPRRDGILRPVERTLVVGGREVPFEAVPPPEEGAWRSFCGQLREDLATLQAPALLDRLSLAEEVGVGCLSRVRHLGEFGAALRRRLENASVPVRYLEVTTSELARTEAFRRFAGWIVQDAEWFWTCHNGALDRYRREQGLRSAAQPFPNLRRQDGLVELPFWLVRGGRRRSVWARPGSPPVLVCEGQVVGDLQEVSRELRPRALTLTLFLRLVVADLFVHGLGGARYDRVTDRVLQEFFGISAPPFAVLTGTFHLPLARHPDPRAEYAAVHRLWLDLQHNPDRHLSAEGEAEPLVREKWRCIQALQSPDLPRRDRRELTQRIRLLNQALRQHLEARIREVQGQLVALRREVEEHEAATDRAYSFVLFDPEEVRRPLGACSETPSAGGSGPQGPGGGVRRRSATEGVRCGR